MLDLGNLFEPFMSQFTLLNLDKTLNLILMLLICCFTCNYLVNGSLPLAPYSFFHMLRVPPRAIWASKLLYQVYQKPVDGRTDPRLGFLVHHDTPTIQDWVCLCPFQVDSLRQQLSRGEITPPGSRKEAEPSSSQTAKTHNMAMKAQAPL